MTTAFNNEKIFLWKLQLSRTLKRGEQELMSSSKSPFIECSIKVAYSIMNWQILSCSEHNYLTLPSSFEPLENVLCLIVVIVNRQRAWFPTHCIRDSQRWWYSSHTFLYEQILIYAVILKSLDARNNMLAILHTSVLIALFFRHCLCWSSSLFEITPLQS